MTQIAFANDEQLDSIYPVDTPFEQIEWKLVSQNAGLQVDDFFVPDVEVDFVAFNDRPFTNLTAENSNEDNTVEDPGADVEVDDEEEDVYSDHD